MRTFNVNVNGVLYQVEVEEIAAGAPAAAAPARPAAGPRRPIPGAAAPRAAAPKAAAPKPAPKAAAPAPAAAPAGKGENINAPMPGNILDVRVANGQAVNSGDILMILEAIERDHRPLRRHRIQPVRPEGFHRFLRPAAVLHRLIVRSPNYGYRCT